MLEWLDRKQPVFPFSGLRRSYDLGMGCYIPLIVGFFVGAAAIGSAIQFSLTPGLFHPGMYLYVFGCVIGQAAFILSIMGVSRAFAARQEQRIIQRLMEEAWTVWQYDAEEWQIIAQAQSEYERRIYKGRHAVVISVLVVGFFVYLSLSVKVGPEIQLLYLAVGFFLALAILLMGLFAQIHQRITSRRNYQARLGAATPKLYVGAGGLYHETEGFIQFKQIIELTLHRNKPAVTFTVLLALPSRLGSRHIRTDLLIPIPRHHIEDAQRLIAQQGK